MEQKNKYSITYIKKRKKDPYRCRVQLDGKRTYKYFPTRASAEKHVEFIKQRQSRKYKRGDIVYHSLGSLYKDWREEKTMEVEPSTLVHYDNAFKFLQPLHKSWFKDISVEDCESLLKKEADIHKEKIYRSFYILEQLNILSKDKYKQDLDWSPRRLKK